MQRGLVSFWSFSKRFQSCQLLMKEHQHLLVRVSWFALLLYTLILPLTLKEHHLLVLYEAMMALALNLIDGSTAHLLKAAYIYLLGLYICTNSNCFVLPVLGLLPLSLWGRASTIIILSTPSELQHMLIIKASTHAGTDTKCSRLFSSSVFYFQQKIYTVGWAEDTTGVDDMQIKFRDKT